MPIEQAIRQLAVLDTLVYVAPELPAYIPRLKVSGPLDSVGAAQQGEWMERAFAKFVQYHPGVYKGDEWKHPGSSAAMCAVLANVGDISPLGRELGRDEAKQYFYRYGVPGPLTIRLAHGARLAEVRSSAMAMYVNAANPVRQLMVAQLDAIYSLKPSGKSGAITRWSQLADGGVVADDSLVPYIFGGSGAPASNQSAVLKSEAWRQEVRTVALKTSMEAVANDRSAIALGYFDDPTPGIRLVPIAFDAHTPASSGSLDDVARGRYPLTRDVFVLVHRTKDRPMSPQAVEFMRFLLSKEGQEIGVLEGYFPLSAVEVREQLRNVVTR